MEKLKMFDMITRKARQWWFITLSILMYHIVNGRKSLWRSRSPPLIPYHGPCPSAQPLLWAKNSSSQYPTYISMTSHLISEGCPDQSNTFHLCSLCVKTGLCPYFFSFFRWNKANPEIFPSEVMFAGECSCCPSLAPPCGPSLSWIYGTWHWSPVPSTMLFEYLHTNI